MTYRIALEKLLAYPVKKLIACDYELNGEFCALVVIAPATRPLGGRGIHQAVAESREVANELRRLRLSIAKASDLQEVNDQFEGSTEDRYAEVVRWLEAEVAKETT